MKTREEDKNHCKRNATIGLSHQSCAELIFAEPEQDEAFIIGHSCVYFEGLDGAQKNAGSCRLVRRREHNVALKRLLSVQF